jgi:hypothetical protein
MDALSINQVNNLEFEEKITCGKIKSKAKTLWTIKINKNPTPNKDTENTLIIPTIKVNKIIINYTNSTDFDTICSYLVNSTILVSNSLNPKDSNLHILVLPGYLCEIKKNGSNKIEIDIRFKNFFSHNIPANINDIHFMIWFKNLLPNGLIEKTNLLTEVMDIPINKSNIIKIEKFIFLSVQQTQTFNVICKNKTLDIVVKKTNFNNMCRVFWIKINITDYNNLEEFKLELNGQSRLNLGKKQMELVCDKKIIYDGYVLIFLNLELGSGDWTLPQDLKQITSIYSNSLNTTRIDTIKWSFKFTNKFTHDNIQITSLSLNNLNLDDNNLHWKYF